MLDRRQIEATTRRYERREVERQGTKEKIAAGELLQADDPARVEKRLERLGVPPATAKEVVRSGATVSELTGAEARRDAPARTRRVAAALERIIGKSDFLGSGFLTWGSRAARSVCRIQVPDPDGGGILRGTGVLVSPRLVLTNNHVLADPETARPATLEFDFELGPDNREPRPVRFELDPDACFLTDFDLDYTLVAVRPEGSEGKALADYAWVPLIAQEGKAISGECVNIVQHPNGEPKQVALRENRIVDVLDQFLHYETDTAPGSSGSPVFNDAWEMVALHHSGVPATDDDGNILALDGGVWSEEMGEHKVKWLANEGARVSRIVAHARAHAAESGASELVAQAISGAAPSAADIPRAEPDGPRRPRVLPLAAARDEGADLSPDTGGTATWTIPLLVSVRLGTSTFRSGGAAEERGLAGDAELRRALDELERGRARPYYDRAADEAARERYYRGLPERRSGESFFAALHDLLADSHANQPRYKPREHLYPWVDLQPDGMLKSIYTGEAFDPRDFIEADIRIERARERRRQELLATEAARGGPALREALALLEAEMPFNCEHVVPQSWFGEREPMRGDLHHLFACQARCNSFRGNRPFVDFVDFGEAVRDDCGKLIEGEGFEPLAGKGAAARATLYFLLRYPGEIDRTGAEYEADRLDLLVAWHREEEVSDYERHRNAAIFEKQGNRNPLVDFPEWAEVVAFEFGLGPSGGR